MTVPQYLKAKRLKPSQLAKLLGIPRVLVCRWAKGVVPQNENLRRLIEGTGGEITANDVLGVRTGRRRKAA